MSASFKQNFVSVFMRILQRLLTQWGVIATIPSGGYTLSAYASTGIFHVHPVQQNGLMRYWTGNSRWTILTSMEELLNDTKDIAILLYESLLDVRKITYLTSRSAEKKDVGISLGFTTITATVNTPLLTSTGATGVVAAAAAAAGVTNESPPPSTSTLYQVQDKSPDIVFSKDKTPMHPALVQTQAMQQLLTDYTMEQTILHRARQLVDIHVHMVKAVPGLTAAKQAYTTDTEYQSSIQRLITNASHFTADLGDQLRKLSEVGFPIRCTPSLTTTTTTTTST